MLFDGEAELRTTMTDAIGDAPAGLGPLALVVRAYTAAVPLLVAGRPIAERRAEVIDTAPALQERAQAKAAALLEAVIAAVAARGVPGPTARLAGQVGAAAFDRASRAWGGDPSLDLAGLIAQAADEVRRLD